MQTVPTLLGHMTVSARKVILEMDAYVQVQFFFLYIQLHIRYFEFPWYHVDLIDTFDC